MAKEKKVKAEKVPKEKKVRGVSINTKLVEFVAQCARENILAQDKATVIEAYQTATGVKSAKNIDNIAKRNLRPEVLGTLSVALGTVGMSYDEYVTIQTELVHKIKRQEKSEVATE